MIKVIQLIRRKAGWSFDDFKDYYENHHSKLIRTAPLAIRYRRRYLTPFVDPFHPQDERASYDVMTEVWFADQASMEETFFNQDPANVRLIVEDEAHFMDRAASLLYTIEDVETPLARA
uniref:Ethyl tert-butyl ether degradation EthD n=1 Tax=Sphingomonas sp. JE1 TaxID=1628059 RepID=A0A0D4ZZ09_9SPHN|nr:MULTISPECIES: EthD domain-containing protein [unclassified Sphingomonas]AJW29512.1 Ethyl tert-butyl ether degradation EthD [Sphingomonas sp. JE1]